MPDENNDFIEQQRRAIERLNEMQRRAQINGNSHQMPPVPDFVKVQPNNRRPEAKSTEQENNTQKNIEEKTDYIPQRQNRQNSAGSFFSNFRFPFQNGINLDKDISLVLGILLILANEKADRKLLLALLYILM